MAETTLAPPPVAAEEMLRRLRDPDYIRPVLHINTDNTSEAVFQGLAFIEENPALALIVEVERDQDGFTTPSWIRYQGIEYKEKGLGYVLQMVKEDLESGRLAAVERYMASRAG